MVYVAITDICNCNSPLRVSDYLVVSYSLKLSLEVSIPTLEYDSLSMTPLRTEQPYLGIPYFLWLSFREVHTNDPECSLTLFLRSCLSHLTLKLKAMSKYLEYNIQLCFIILASREHTFSIKAITPGLTWVKVLKEWKEP